MVFFPSIQLKVTLMMFELKWQGFRLHFFLQHGRFYSLSIRLNMDLCINRESFVLITSFCRRQIRCGLKALKGKIKENKIKYRLPAFIPLLVFSEAFVLIFVKKPRAFEIKRIKINRFVCSLFMYGNHPECPINTFPNDKKCNFVENQSICKLQF